MSETTEDRFWAKVQVTGFCWLWTGASGRGGYGLFRAEARRTEGAHRFAYKTLVGPIPEGLVLDHLCRVRNCVNPDHTEPVTLRENTARGLNAGAVALRTGRCVNGHPIVQNDSRQCRACKRDRNRAAKARRVACPSCGEQMRAGSLLVHRGRNHDAR